MGAGERLVSTDREPGTGYLKSFGAFGNARPGPRSLGFLRNLPTNTTVFLRGL